MTLTEKEKQNGWQEDRWEEVEVSLNDVINCIDDDDFEGLSSLLFGKYYEVQ